MRFVCGVFLLLTLPALARTHVVTDFRNTCPDFFWKDQNEQLFAPTIFTEVNPPNHDRYQKICQQRIPTQNNYIHQYEFATLYDTLNKIPVYSAYGFRGLVNIDRRGYSWYIEPQLDNAHEIDQQGTAVNGRLRAMGTYQALNTDYVGSGYDRGHLFPVSHTSEEPTEEATFTLTNAVPQARCLNEIWWKDMEVAVGRYLHNNCLRHGKQAYVVTGAVPSRNRNSVTIGPGRVNVPEHLWTAFCCYDNNQKRWMSKAHRALNGNSEIVTEETLVQLETWLSGDEGYRQQFFIFGGQCRTDTGTGIYHHQSNRVAG